METRVARPVVEGDPDRLLESAVGELRHSIEEAGRRRALDLPVQVAKAVVYVHRHVFEPKLNAAAVRTGCGVRNHNLTTFFHRTLGATLRDCIEGLRLEAAGRLLRSVPVEAFLIAAAVGYDNYETFCRAFRRRFGCTPRSLRTPANPMGQLP